MLTSQLYPVRQYSEDFHCFNGCEAMTKANVTYSRDFTDHVEKGTEIEFENKHYLQTKLKIQIPLMPLLVRRVICLKSFFSMDIIMIKDMTKNSWFYK